MMQNPDLLWALAKEREREALRHGAAARPAERGWFTRWASARLSGRSGRAVQVPAAYPETGAAGACTEPARVVTVAMADRTWATDAASESERVLCLKP